MCVVVNLVVVLLNCIKVNARQKKQVENQEKKVIL